MKHVTCSTCQKKYTHIFSENSENQAKNCSSDYSSKEKSIISHYGSDYDTSKFNVKNNIFQDGNICDECIKNALINKDITLDDTFYFWETVKALKKHGEKY